MDSRITARSLAAALGGWRTREPAYEALADGIRLLCLDNRIAARTALPAERELAASLQAGLPTVHDILDALASPGRDPRADLPAPLTRQAIVKLSELKPGTILHGTVRNITDFGAFVDIGLHEDGLIHISELAKRRVKHPLEVVSIGQVLRVMVISVDEKRGRIGLSLKRVPEEVSV